jgi:hypothetical protein
MSPADLITNPFSRHSTAQDVIAGIDLTGRRAVVTGASSGYWRRDRTSVGDGRGRR